MSLTLEAIDARSVACASIEEKFVDVAGCRVRYLTGGRGPALLLVHGLLAYSFSWRFNLQALAQKATVYAPDLPGMGFSQRVPNPAPGLAPTAEIILDFMKTLGISSASLLGSSHGGGAVLLAAPFAAPQGIKIEKLILVSPVNPWSLQGTRITDLLATSWGAALFRDRAVYPSSAGTLLKHFPQGKLVTMRGAGHVPYEENPDEFNRIVLDFLAQS